MQVVVKVVHIVRRGGLSQATIIAALQAHEPTFTAEVNTAVAPILSGTAVDHWSHRAIEADLSLWPQNSWEVYPKLVLFVPDTATPQELGAVQQAASDAITATLTTYTGGQGWTELGRFTNDYIVP